MHNIMGKIKILMVLGTPAREGAQSFCVNILKRIDKNIFHVDFVFMSDEKNGYYTEITSLGSSIFSLPHYNGLNKLVFKRAWNSFFDSHYYDIVHAHATGAAYIYLNIAKKHDCITISHSHSAYYRGNALAILIKKISAKKVARISDYCLACSKNAAIRLFGKRYSFMNNFYLMPNLIFTDNFKYNVANCDKIKVQLSLEKSARIYGHLGSLTKPKNHSFLLDVFALIKKKESNSVLVLVGDGPLMPSIIKKAKKLNIFESIKFVGNVSNPNDYLHCFDVMIFPSLFEGFPMSLIEAQACGVYTIASDTITTETVLSDNIEFLNIKQGPYLWAEKAMSVVKQIDKQKSFEYVKQSIYDIDKGVHILENIYKTAFNCRK